MALRLLCCLVIAMAAAAPGLGRDIYANHETGDDAAAGEVDTPLRTIALAVKRAEAGDTIHLAPTATPYPECVTFYDRSGEEGRPITLDGHGATVAGDEPLDPAAWEQVAPGLYRGAPPVSADPAVTGRWFFLFDRRMERMGRSLKGPHPAYKQPADLQPGEWTWLEDEQRYYLRTPGDRPLAQCDIRAPMRSNGVAVAGHCEHLVIRNLTATHVYNDGFNIHGFSRDVLFENVRALECGDDGISAHDDCRIRVDGMVAMGNSTGVCHVGQGHSESRRMYLAGNHGFEYYVLNTGVHELRDSRVICDAAQSVVCVGDEADGAVCTLRLDHVLVQGTGASDIIKANRNSVIKATRLTVYGLSISAAGAAFSLHDSIVAGAPPPYIIVYPHTRWQAARNLYDLQYLRVGADSWGAAHFADYQAAIGQDGGSTWATVSFAEPFDGRIVGPEIAGVGADPTRLPGIDLATGEARP